MYAKRGEFPGITKASNTTWQAQVQVNKKHYSVYGFKTPYAAYLGYLQLAKQHGIENKYAKI